MITRKKIAVIGGGNAGLKFARALTTLEYEIYIFEKKEYFGEIGGAISVFPNALCVMDNIGLLSKILALSGQFKNVYLNILSITEAPFLEGITFGAVW